MAKPLFNANIQEYAGYTPPNQIDFNKIFDEAEKDIGGVIKAREQERAKNEEFASATEKALTDFSTNVNQDFSTFVGEGLNNYRNLNLQYYKQLKNNEIDSTQYRMLVNRIQEDWGEFGEFSKNFEARLKDITDRETAGTSSKIEYDFFGQKISKASDFGNKSLIPDAKSGGLFMVTTGADGKEVKEAITTRSLNNFQRQKVDKFDLMNSIEKQTDIVNKQNSELRFTLEAKADKITEAGGGVSKWLAENRPELLADYEAFIAGVKGSVMKQPPNSVASALVDNLVPMEKDASSATGYKAVPGQDWFMYETDAELKEKVKGGADKRFGIKMIKQGDGSLAAQLTKEQDEYLDASIQRIADAQIGYEQKTTKGLGESPEAREERELRLQKEKIEGQLKLEKQKGKNRMALENLQSQNDEDLLKLKDELKDTPIAGLSDDDKKNIYYNTNQVASGQSVSLLNGSKDGDLTIQNAQVSPNGKEITWDQIGDDGAIVGTGVVQIVDDNGETINREQIAKLLYPKQAKDNQFDLMDTYREGKALYSEEDQKKIEAVTKGEARPFTLSLEGIDPASAEYRIRKDERKQIENFIEADFSGTTKVDEGNQVVEVVNRDDGRYTFIDGLITDMGYDIGDYDLIVRDDMMIIREKDDLGMPVRESSPLDFDNYDVPLFSPTTDADIDEYVAIISNFLTKK